MAKFFFVVPPQERNVGEKLVSVVEVPPVVIDADLESACFRQFGLHLEEELAG